MNEGILSNEVLSRTYRYQLTWIFLIPSLGMAGFSVWKYTLSGTSIAVCSLLIALCLFAAYLEWKTFFLQLDNDGISVGSVFYKRAIRYKNIKSVDYIFGKSSEFIAIKTKTGRVLTIWMYLQDFKNVHLIIAGKGRQAGALVRERHQGGEWLSR